MWLSTDAVIYKYLAKPMAAKLCTVVSPNTVTLLCFLVIFPIAHNILTRGSSNAALVGLVLARAFLDCLDGSIARKCNTGTSHGAMLDITNDAVSLCVLAGVVLYVAGPASPIALALCLAAGITCYQWWMELSPERRKHRWQHTIVRLGHDNTVLLWLGAAIAINAFVKTVDN